MIATPAAASLALDEAAAFLGLHPDTLRERAAAGIIPGAKIGKQWRFIEADLVAYFRAQYGAKGKQRKWRSSNAAQSGGSTSGTAADELDALLELRTSPPRKDNTTNLRLVSGKNGKRAVDSRTRSSDGSKPAPGADKS